MDGLAVWLHHQNDNDEDDGAADDNVHYHHDLNDQLKLCCR